MPTVGDSLATFLGNRLSMSFANLGCDAFGLTDPVNVTAAGDGGLATAVSYNTAQQQATLPAPQAPPSPGTDRDRDKHRDRDRDDRTGHDRDRAAAATVAVARPPPLAALRHVTSHRQ